MYADSRAERGPIGGVGREVLGDVGRMGLPRAGRSEERPRQRGRHLAGTVDGEPRTGPEDGHLPRGAHVRPPTLATYPDHLPFSINKRSIPNERFQLSTV